MVKSQLCMVLLMIITITILASNVNAITFTDTFINTTLPGNLTINISSAIYADSITVTNRSVYFIGLRSSADSKSRISFNLTEQNVSYNGINLPVITQVSNNFTTITSGLNQDFNALVFNFTIGNCNYINDIYYTSADGTYTKTYDDGWIFDDYECSNGVVTLDDGITGIELGINRLEYDYQDESETSTYYWTTNTFNNSLTNESLYLDGTNNVTRYLHVPEGIFLTTGDINLTVEYNLSQSSQCLQEFAQTATACGGVVGVNQYSANANLIDGDYTTADSTAGRLLIVNYTKPQGAVAPYILQTKDASTGGMENLTIPIGCYNFYPNIIQITGLSDGGSTASIQCTSGNGAYTTLDTYASSPQIYEEAMYWNITTYAKNVSLNIGNKEVNYTYTTESHLFNVANFVNIYLLTCSYLNGFCNVPFIFHADTLGILRYSNLNFSNIGFNNNNQIYNSTAYDTANEGFILNLSYDNNTNINIAANLIYDGTSYSTTKVGTGNNLLFSRNIEVPAVTGPSNKSFLWQVTLTNSTATVYLNTSNYTQIINPINLSLCSGNNNITYFNYTVMDEANNTLLDGIFNSLTFYYYLSSSAKNKSYTRSATSAAGSYAFCFSPGNKEITTSGEIQYSASGYPQRRYSFNPTTYTNSTTNKVIYLLSTNDGIYSAIQTVTTSQSRITGVSIIAERQIDGVWTVVEQGTTDDSGMVTFWVNPNYDHRLTATKDGYSTTQVTLRPSQSTYTLVMALAGVSSNATYSVPLQGLKWNINRGSGTLKAGTYTFTVNVSDTTGSLENCKFELIHSSNGSILASNTGITNTTFCSVSVTSTLTKGQQIFGRLSVDTKNTNGFVIVDSDWKWIVFDKDVRTWSTIWSFFDDFRTTTEFGSDSNRAEFSRFVFIFFMMTLIIAIFTFTTNAEIQSPGVSLFIVWGIVLISSLSGLLTFSSGSDAINPIFEKYGFLIIFSFLVGGYAFNQWRRTE